MKLKTFLIAGGNPTLLVWTDKPDKKQQIITKYLKDFDQIGFIENGKLQMMGDELCINALLAFEFERNGIAEIDISLRFKIIRNVVLLNGIGFICLKTDKYIDLRKLAKKYNLPAFGKIIYENNRITPYIFVNKVNSSKNETACGSGSIALNILKGYREIVQPTGEKISVSRNKNNFNVKAKVKEVKICKWKDLKIIIH